MSPFDIDRSRAGWWVLGGSLAFVLGFVIYSFIGTFVFGLFIYYATRPIYRRIRRRIWPASLAAAIALFALALPALGLVAWALLIALQEIDRFTAGATFDFTQYPGVDPELLVLLSNPETLAEMDLSEYLTVEVAQSVFQSLGSAADTLAFFGVGAVHLFVMLAMAFYLLRDDHRLSRWFRMHFADDRGILEAYAGAVDRDFNNIFFGNILNAILTGTIGVLMYTLLNFVAPPSIRIPAAALVGLIAGVASLIPVVGMKLVYVPVALYLAAVSLLGGGSTLWFVAAFVVVSFLVVDTIPDLVLRPYVSGRSLHVGAVMIAYTFGPLLFGWYGIFLMPILLVLVVHFARIVLPELLRGEPIRPYMIDPGAFTADEEGTDTAVDDPGEDDDGDDHDEAVAVDDASTTTDEAEPTRDRSTGGRTDRSGASGSGATGAE